MEKLKILWIDDDINNWALRPYIDTFNENGFEIIHAKDPDESDRILTKSKDFRCIIIDLMMATGSKISHEESKGGIQTGLILLQKLMADESLSNIKKVIFTKINDLETKNFCNVQEPAIPYLKKLDDTTGGFVDKIKLIINN